MLDVQVRAVRTPVVQLEAEVGGPFTACLQQPKPSACLQHPKPSAAKADSFVLCLYIYIYGLCIYDLYIYGFIIDGLEKLCLD